MVRIFFAFVVAIIVVYGILLALPATETATNTETSTSTPVAVASTTVIASNLQIPWDIAFLPDATLLVTERVGTLVHLDPKTGNQTEIPVSERARGEGGLLGITLHPDFANNAFVYLYMSDPSGSETTNKIVRYTYRGATLTEDRVIIDRIPGALYHDGGRMEFGPDGKLYVTTGDATRGALAQDKKSLAGKILRLNDDGTIPSDNPFANAVWSYGHRNPQGLAWDSNGRLWETEHGPTGENGTCCHDEINLIEKGGNYGWPTIIGDERREGMISPVWHSGESTWAPASLVFFDDRLYFGGLIGEAVFEAAISGNTIASLKRDLFETYGRIRTIRRGPDNMFYITTSNTDGRGVAGPTDDRIIRINPNAVR